MSKLQYLALGLMGLMLTGCASFTPTGPIGMPSEAIEQAIPRGAMVKDVQVTDTRVSSRQKLNIEKGLTAQITRHIEQGQYFERVIAFPATLGQQDVELQFTFNALHGKRSPHAAYFPGAILTATLWIWFNGPIYVDNYDLAGELKVVDLNGQQLALAEKAIRMKKNTGLWDRDYWVAGSLGHTQLTSLVEGLLKDASQQLSK